MHRQDAYELAAQLHRPSDEHGLRTAARDLARQGLKARDIASALSITEQAALALLNTGDIHANGSH